MYFCFQTHVEFCFGEQKCRWCELSEIVKQRKLKMFVLCILWVGVKFDSLSNVSKYLPFSLFLSYYTIVALLALILLGFNVMPLVEVVFCIVSFHLCMVLIFRLIILVRAAPLHDNITNKSTVNLNANFVCFDGNGKFTVGQLLHWLQLATMTYTIVERSILLVCV